MYRTYFLPPFDHNSKQQREGPFSHHLNPSLVFAYTAKTGQAIKSISELLQRVYGSEHGS